MPQPPRIALLTAHGQPSAPARPEAALALLAGQVQDLLPDWQIGSATLATPGRLEAVMTKHAVIYPFFMARGWFVGRVLQQRLQGIAHHLACPFGLDPALPALAADVIQQMIQRQGWTVQDTTVLLAAHGSARGAKAAEAVAKFRQALSPLLSLAGIEAGFIEQSPSVETAARPLGPFTLCLPFFAQPGEHVRDDIPHALKAANFQGQLLPVTGALPGVAQLIAQAIVTADHNRG